MQLRQQGTVYYEFNVKTYTICICIWVYLVFIEGACHSVPQRAKSPLHLGAFLHLLCTILLLLSPDGSDGELKTKRTF